jgi:predicted nucleotide-binding protein
MTAMVTTVLPRLVIDIDVARTKLSTQAESGRELLESANGFLSESVFDDLTRRHKSWCDYNDTLLRSLFDSEAVAKKYSDDTYVFEWASGRTRIDFENMRQVTETHGSDPHESLKRRIEKGVHFLDGLLQRLDLYPQARRSSNRGALTVSVRARAESNNVFIVHGHDKAAKESTIRFVEKLGLTPIVFDESPNKGQTIIEKLEELASDAAFAIILFTPDDVGGQVGPTSKLQRRARQNVIFELGFFAGRLGRDRVCLLYKEEMEIPSDLHGVLYVKLDDYEGWHVRLAREMKAADLSLDFNSLL